MDKPISRRRFLAQAVKNSLLINSARLASTVSLPLSLAACGGSNSSSVVSSTISNQSLPIPPLDSGTIDSLTGRRVYNLTMQQGTHEFISGIQTSTLGYNGNFLGPTLRLRRQDNVDINVSNNIGETTTTHWHGMHLAATEDGGPHQEIATGKSWRAAFTVLNEAATLWYHPHPHGTTGEQVFRGLAGMIIVDDANSDALNLPSEYGVDDIPIVIQDRRFNTDGSLAYLTQMRDRTGMKGDHILVNGSETPVLSAPAQWLRLRILNGSNARIYNLGLSNNRSFQQIASDGGLLVAPASLTRLLISPGERAEIMIDLSGDLNNSLKLVSYSSEVSNLMGGGMGAGGMGGDTLANSNFDIMTITVDKAAVNRPQLPSTMNTIPTLTATVNRPFSLEVSAGRFTINRKSMDLTRIDETITLGTTEIWSITNNNGMAHPFHIHDQQFQIISRDGSPPAANESGWKDTVLLKANETVQIIVKFSDFSDPNTPYMYHCHILEHEDDGMMGQFIVV